jgi:hypothetical protein
MTSVDISPFGMGAGGRGGGVRVFMRVFSKIYSLEITFKNALIIIPGTKRKLQ